MTAKEWLESAWYCKEQIKNLQEIKNEMLESTVCITKPVQNVTVQSSPKNLSEERILKYMADARDIDEAIERLKDQRRAVIKTIYLVADFRLQRLLTLRYLKALSWESIAERMGLSEKWVRTKLHYKALLEIENVIEKPF